MASAGGLRDVTSVTIADRATIHFWFLHGRKSPVVFGLRHCWTASQLSATAALKLITHFSSKSKAEVKALSQSLWLFVVPKYARLSTLFNLFSPLYRRASLRAAQMFLHRLCMKRRRYLDRHSLLAPLKRDKASPSGGMPTFIPAPHVFPVCPEWTETNREEGESRTSQLSPKFLGEEFPPH